MRGTGDSTQDGYDLQVTWAQIALVYRQRDFERIVDLCGQLGFGSSERPQEPAVSTAAHTERRRSESLRYRFDIDAPLLFLPASTGKKCQSGARGGLSTDTSRSERTFQPLEEEGYAVLDFGNCLVESDLSSSAVRISMTRLQVFFASATATWHQILSPVTAEVEVLSSNESLDIRVHAPLCPEAGRPLEPNISLTRAHATQFFDVLYLNLSYASAEEAPWSRLLARSAEVEALREALKVRLQQLEELQPGRGFLFSLRWTGALILDAGFTVNSSLARLEIMDGCFEYRRPPSKGEPVARYIHFQCQGGCVRDTRRDCMGLLIDLPCTQESLGLEVLATMPAENASCTQIAVDLSQLLVSMSMYSQAASFTAVRVAREAWILSSLSILKEEVQDM